MGADCVFVFSMAEPASQVGLEGLLALYAASVAGGRYPGASRACSVLVDVGGCADDPGTRYSVEAPVFAYHEVIFTPEAIIVETGYRLYQAAEAQALIDWWVANTGASVWVAADTSIDFDHDWSWWIQPQLAEIGHPVSRDAAGAWIVDWQEVDE